MNHIPYIVCFTTEYFLLVYFAETEVLAPALNTPPSPTDHVSWVQL